MSERYRENWDQKIEDVLRSRHYTWLGRGLGGDPVDEAMIALTADIMHICKRHGIDWDWLVEQSRTKFEQEESELLECETA